MAEGGREGERSLRASLAERVITTTTTTTNDNNTNSSSSSSSSSSNRSNNNDNDNERVISTRPDEPFGSSIVYYMMFNCLILSYIDYFNYIMIIMLY